jgi:hypothetical protein
LDTSKKNFNTFDNTVGPSEARLPDRGPSSCSKTSSEDTLNTVTQPLALNLRQIDSPRRPFMPHDHTIIESDQGALEEFISS